MKDPTMKHLRSREEGETWREEKDRREMERLIEKLYAAASAEARMIRLEEKIDEILSLLKK
nr:hypothetical protein [Paracoccus saliphilus]